MSTHDDFAGYGGVAVATESRNPLVQKEEPFDKRFPLARNPVALTVQQKELVYKDLRIPSLGKSEFEFALLRIEEGTENIGKVVDKIVDAHRQQFYGGLLGKVSHRLALITKSTEEWNRIYNESEQAARRSLMQGSGLSKLDALQAEAIRAQEEANAVQRELDKAFHEHRAIPGKVDAIKNRLNVIKAERDHNNLESLLEEFRRAYGHWFKTGITANYNDQEFSSRIVLAGEKLAVLDVAEKGLLEEIDRLKKHSRDLAKQLGIKDHENL